MIYDVYTFAYNEEEMVDLFLSHYSDARKIYVHNNQSTDKTVEKLLKDERVEIIEWDEPYDEQKFTELKNNCWKGSDSDWVIVCDFDELLNVDMNTNATIIDPHGITVVSSKMLKEIKKDSMGIISGGCGKMAVFRPDKITEINYMQGAHEAFPEGDVNIEKQGYLYHCSLVGKDRIVKRNKQRFERVCKLTPKAKTLMTFFNKAMKEAKTIYDLENTNR